jgi:hypothetical protein
MVIRRDDRERRKANASQREEFFRFHKTPAP